MAEQITMLDEPPTTELTVIERAELALNAKQARIDLAAQVKKSENVKEVKNAAGREEAHSYAMALVKARTTLEKVGKAKREDATAFSKAVIALEKELLQITTPEENRLLALRDKWDADRLAEKEEAERLQRVRIEAISLRIANIQQLPIMALRAATSTDAQSLIDNLGATELAGFDEFTDEALATKVSALARMREIVATKKATEDQAARIKAEQDAERVRLAEERAELDRQRAENARIAAENKAALDKIEAVKRAEQEAAAKAELDRRNAEAKALEAVAPPARAQPVAEEPAPLPAQTFTPPAPYSVERTEPVPAASPPTMTNGKVCQILGFNVTADFLVSIGAPAPTKQGNANLWHDRQILAICEALGQHLQAVHTAQKAKYQPARTRTPA